MDLEAYKQTRKLSWRDVAELIGVRQAKQARAYGTGQDWPKAARLEAIVAATKGVVTVEDMHRRRLAYETKNLRPRRRPREVVPGVPPR